MTEVVQLPPIPLLPDDMRMDRADPTLLHDELRAIITDAIVNHPRSLQADIGPSEVGTPCPRKLAYKLGAVPVTNPGAVKWRAAVGTAVHAQLAEWLVLDNAANAHRRAGLPRWIVECRVSPGEINGKPLIGSADGYDRCTGDVFDWKIPGPTTMRKVRSNGPSIGYRTQAHLYGRGFARRGLPVRNVHVLNLPATGELSDAVWWHEPYDEQIAVDALGRATNIDRAGQALGFGLVAATSPTADDYCGSCEWFTPNADNPAEGRCPGAASVIAEREQRRNRGGVPSGLKGLIAP